MDIKADLDMIREYEADMKFYNEYTEKFVSQFRYITETVSSRIIERTAYEGFFIMPTEKWFSLFMKKVKEYLILNLTE